MNRFSLPLAGLALVTAGLLVAGCGPSSSSSSTSGGQPSAPATGSSGSSSSSAPTSSGSGGLDTTLFPATVGNTWVYESTLSGGKTGTTTNKVTAVTPDSDGEKVTFTTEAHVAGLPATPTTLTYQLYSDGRIGVPYTQVGNSTVKIKGGGIVWPSKAQLDSGQPTTSTLTLQISLEGHSVKVTAHVTVKGEGTQSITVPAGTFQATLVNESVAESLDGINIVSQVDTWLATGIGPVKSTVTSKTGSTSLVLTSEVLKSFKQG